MDLTADAKRAFSLQSYGPAPRPEGVQIVDLPRHVDDSGALTELARLEAGALRSLPGFTAQQVTYSELAPGAIKAFHVHVRQTDVWFVPPSDRLLCVLVDVRKGSKTEGVRSRIVLGDGQSRLIRIPPGVAHGARNLAAGPGRVIYFTDLCFTPDPATCDEGRLPWDFAGAEVWDVSHG
ncbi:MAG: dTDP-4-dehydrorhamnose 3,5-epimerase [Candidatus Rokuibacteriota bacterium]|nr:MAG: dTDP-4-dehydrorhamnose 3,5-epimerase [Candidatus Rokubacteria bacterium]